MNVTGLNPATENLVWRFSIALALKLRAAEEKYGYSDGWLADDWMDECRAKLREHIEKGDPRDVAAYCAFLWHHNQSTAPQASGSPEHVKDSANPAGSVVRSAAADSTPEAERG